MILNSKEKTFFYGIDNGRQSKWFSILWLLAFGLMFQLDFVEWWVNGKKDRTVVYRQLGYKCVFSFLKAFYESNWESDFLRNSNDQNITWQYAFIGKNSKEKSIMMIYGGLVANLLFLPKI